MRRAETEDWVDGDSGGNDFIQEDMMSVRSDKWTGELDTKIQRNRPK